MSKNTSFFVIVNLGIQQNRKHVFQKDGVSMAKHRILLVDDDTDILEINRSFLTNEGYDVSVATNIAQTLQKVETNSYDCIVLDIMLPDGNAYDLPSKIHVYTNAPIIFLSAKDQLEDKITGYIGGQQIWLDEDGNVLWSRVDEQFLNK